ncbi:MAG TPA: DUF4124 domain-containing protein [Nitrospiria bacterium]|jgi:hypothetical protein
MKVTFFILSLFILFNSKPLLGKAEIYQYKDHQGQKVFTNDMSKVPPEFRKEVDIIQEKNLPPLHLIADSPVPRKEKENPRPPLQSSFLFYAAFILLTVLMFLGFTLKGFKGSLIRIGFKLLAMAFISIAIAIIFLVQGGIIPFQTMETSLSGSSSFSPIQKIQKKVEQVEKDFKNKENLLNLVNP